MTKLSPKHKPALKVLELQPVTIQMRLMDFQAGKVESWGGEGMGGRGVGAFCPQLKVGCCVCPNFCRNRKQAELENSKRDAGPGFI